MIYGYVRVSTGKQDGKNQLDGVMKYANEHNLIIDEIIDDEGISGTVDPEKRELGKLLKKLKKGDTLLAGELSRLGRSIFMIFSILDYCTKNGITVITVKDNYILKDDLQSRILAFAFGISAEIERDMISRRTKEALALKKQQGIKIGRKEGSKNPYETLWYAHKEEEIRQLYKQGVKKCKIAEIMGVNRTTLFRDWNKIFD